MGAAGALHAFLLIARLLLAATFATAALAKLADAAGLREAVRAFGVPDALAGTVRAVLPLGELAAAVLLLASPTARAGGALAFILLAAFSAAIARSMIRGESPNCHCFGQLHSAPAGPGTLVRNLALAVLAGIVAVAGAGTSATGWIEQLSTPALFALLGGVAAAMVLAASIGLVISLLRRHGQLLLRIEALEQAVAQRGIALPAAQPRSAPGLPVGMPAPEFELRAVDGKSVTLRSLLKVGRPLLLAFTDPGCGPCNALLPQLAAWQRDAALSLRIVLISRGTDEANLTHASEHSLQDLLIQDDREVSERYGVPATPAAVMVDPDGRIASPLTAGAEAISALLDIRPARPVLPLHRHEPELGRSAPDPMLRTLDGQRIPLSRRLTGRTAVLFWNPACGFCQRMLEDLRRLESSSPPGAPAIVLVSTGDPAANRSMLLRTPILLDDGFSCVTAFGATVTPSAVLIDDARKIASPLAVGAPAVLALAGGGAALYVSP